MRTFTLVTYSLYAGVTQNGFVAASSACLKIAARGSLSRSSGLRRAIFLMTYCDSVAPWLPTLPPSPKTSTKHVQSIKKVKVCVYFYRKLMSESQSITCHMGSHSISCHPTQVNVPQPGRPVLDLHTRRDGKAELTLLNILILCRLEFIRQTVTLYYTNIRLQNSKHGHKTTGPLPPRTHGRPPDHYHLGPMVDHQTTTTSDPW